jgi:SAM-dependent methyltransferase
VSAAVCRCCNSGALDEILDLGNMPLADRLVPTGLSNIVREPRYPLMVVFCPNCALVQLTHRVPAEELFLENYPYYSSFSPQLLEHARRHAEALVENRVLDGSSFVVEVASNDGYLLRNLVQRGIRVLGIDPAEGPAAAAQQINVPTLCEFFDLKTARSIADRYGKADVIFANNVLAHVGDQRDFVAGVAALLKPTGKASIEVPYVRDLLEDCEFDTIYHEHFCYFSVTSVARLLSTGGLKLNDVQRVPIHGGSLRLMVGFADDCSPAVGGMLREEHELGIDRINYYRNFRDRVITLKDALLNTLRELRGRGNRIAAYGAAAKGATLINFTGIGPDLVEYVVDRNFHKHGMSMPGQRIPIVPTERLLEDRPDYVLLLAWNFADEILAQQQQYRDAGGRFIIPVPEVRIV